MLNILALFVLFYIVLRHWMKKDEEKGLKNSLEVAELLAKCRVESISPSDGELTQRK